MHEGVDGGMVAGKTLLVVDDVITTGATLNECSRALLEAGAGKVYGLVLARQSVEQTDSIDPGQKPGSRCRSERRTPY